MQLNKRLSAIEKLIDKGSIVADIGTDHALLPIALIEDDIASKCYACDINEGPLDIARKNIKEHKVEDKILPILSDGLQHVPFNADVIVIAGMGFNNAETILEDGIENIYHAKKVIVQVNKDVEFLRRWISNHHFTIIDELFVYDRHYYQIVVFNHKYHENYSDLNILFGPKLLKNPTTEFIEYHNNELSKYKEILRKLPKNDKQYGFVSKRIQAYESIMIQSKQKRAE